MASATSDDPNKLRKQVAFYESEVRKLEELTAKQKIDYMGQVARLE